MAFFLICIASFFTMVTFWRYMDFAWFTRKDKDFLQVQSEHCNRLCNVIPSLEKFLKDMEASPKTKVLNRNQCIHLYGKLILAMKGIDKMLSSAIGGFKFQSIFEEICCLQKKVEIVGRNCIEQDQWCHSSVLQLQNKETFRELLLDLKCCYSAAYDVYFFLHPNQANNMVPIQFDAPTYEQVIEDGEVLKEKLKFIYQKEVPEDYSMAQHLLWRLKNLEQAVGGDLNDLKFFDNFTRPELIKEIGKGSFGHVYKSNWLGLTSATKVLKGDFEFLSNSRKEASILACLNHPNLVQFFGYGIIKKVDKSLKEEDIGAMHLVMWLKKSSLFKILKNLIYFFGFWIIKRFDEIPKKDDLDEMHLVMELMDSNLSQVLKKSKRPLPYYLAIDIMLQIAKGVYYLHDMQVAHLDLKPDNILSSAIYIEGLDPYYVFKVSDYGTSQLGIYNNPEHPKLSKYTIGTTGYMSPEMTKGRRMPFYPFQADVWSFAMICSEILSRKVPHFGFEPKKFNDQISCTYGTSNKSFRPALPNNCKELTNLIEECWAQDPLQRPAFSNIYKRLTILKKLFLKGIYSCKMVPQFGSSSTLKDFKSIVGHVIKVDEPVAPPKDILIGLDHQLSKVKGLLSRNYVGIVGQGGIGKTTLAKAIFDDVTMNLSYHASCFVQDCKNYQSSHEILCKILPKLGIVQKPKNLKHAHEMMKKFIIGIKLLLILDDIEDEAQVHDIVPPHIVQASKGTTIIITTRKWSTIKSFVGVGGRFDVELLDEKAATKLFTNHLSWSEVPLSPDFDNLRKYVVKACNGLPLSLKGMGSFLHHKERLRSWERALQRMARGKNLDGDEEIWNTLKINFDGFNNAIEKSMFLDVACFFGRDVYPSHISKETLLYMWSRDGILPMKELESLVNMSLLKLNEDGETLEMHDQLRDMGRMFAKNTRIWKASMIPKSKFTKKGVKVLEGISWQGTMNHLSLIKYEHKCHFKNLRVLILMNVLDNLNVHFDNWDKLLQFASQCTRLDAIIIVNSQNSTLLPHTLQIDTPITLQERISNLCATCTSLKILDLIGLGFLKKLPNKFISHTLLRLNLNSCSNLATLPKEVGSLLFLKTLNLGGCGSLVALPKEIGNLSSLTTLDLSECSSLAILPNEVGNLFSLTTLNLRKCSSLANLPKEVGKLSSLITLNLSRCSSLVALPKEVGDMSSLINLHMWGCSSLVDLPKEVGNLTSLTTLDLWRCSSLVALPKELGNLSSLTTLVLWKCSNLAALPEEVGNLSSLTTLDLSKCASLSTLPKEVGNLSSLTTLDLWNCSKLMKLPNQVGNLSSLTALDLSECSSLAALPKEFGNLSSLTTLNLRGCSSLVTLPESIRKLTSLTTLDLRGSSSLTTLPKNIGKLTSLTTLNLHGSSSLATLPESFGNLTSLTTLNLHGSSSLATLPESFGNLTSLTTLNLHGSSSLATLPESFGNLTSLTTLNLRGSSGLATLPKRFGNLTSLTTL